MLDIITTLMLTNDGLSNRTVGFKNAILSVWEFDEDLQESLTTKAVFALHKQYVESETESSAVYDRLKRSFIAVFGEEVFRWALHYTNYFHRTKYLRNKHLRDCVSEIMLITKKAL